MTDLARLTLGALFLSALSGCANIDETETVAELKALGVLVVPGTDGKVNSVNALPTDPAKLTEAVNLLKGLPALKSITAMDGVPVTNDHLATIGTLSQLVELQINSGPVTDEGVASLIGLKKLESLTLAGTEVTEACMASVSKLKRLNMFNINGTKIRGGYEHLAGLKNLQWLLLGGLKISDEDAKKIAEYPSVTHLTLNAATEISDAALTTLKSIQGCNVDGIESRSNGPTAE